MEKKTNIETSFEAKNACDGTGAHASRDSESGKLTIQPRPTQKRLAVTRASKIDGFVLEFNGIPATEAYAEVVGVSIDELGPEIFEKNPIMFQEKGDCVVQSATCVRSDGAMAFPIVIAEGTVVRIGEYDSKTASVEDVA